MILVALIVVGGIYGGVFTPTEGASVGAIAMFVVGVAAAHARLDGDQGQPHPDGRDIGHDLPDPARAPRSSTPSWRCRNCRLRRPTWSAELGLPPYAVVACLLVFYILLGAVMDELAMILLTLPVFFPIVTALDFGMPVRRRRRSGSASWC